MGQQIINKVNCITSERHFSWGIRLGVTGCPLAGTGVYTRLGMLINPKGSSFLPLKEKSKLPGNSKHSYIQMGASPLPSPPQWGNGVSRRKPTQTKHQNPNKQKSKQRVASRLPVVQSWFELQRGTQLLNNESFITRGQRTRDKHCEAAGTVKSKVQQWLGSLRLPCQTLPTWWDSWLPASVFQGWASTDFRGDLSWVDISALA